jgi:hypothetical protein
VTCRLHSGGPWEERKTWFRVHETLFGRSGGVTNPHLFDNFSEPRFRRGIFVVFCDFRVHLGCRLGNILLLLGIHFPLPFSMRFPEL